MKHSPAPWTADPEGQAAVIIEDANGKVICEVHGACNDPLCEANAVLIIAAPDLLAACEALHVRLFREQGGRENSPWAAPLELLSKAIAKAKGK